MNLEGNDIVIFLVQSSSYWIEYVHADGRRDPYLIKFEKQEDLGRLVTTLVLSPMLLLSRPLNPNCSLQDIPQTSLKTLQECHAYFLHHEKANIA